MSDKGVSYRSREDEIRAYVDDCFENGTEPEHYLEIGEMFDIRLDDVEEIEKLLRKYDAEGNYWIGGINNEAI